MASEGGREGGREVGGGGIEGRTEGGRDGGREGWREEGREGGMGGGMEGWRVPSSGHWLRRLSRRRQRSGSAARAIDWVRGLSRRTPRSGLGTCARGPHITRLNGSTARSQWLNKPQCLVLD